VRTSPVLLALIGAVIVVGMWLERFVIVVVSLSQDYMPSAWGNFYPTAWDFAHLIGSVGLFGLLLLLAFRFVPLVSLFELSEAELDAGSRQ
jgi:molybdopterin-containing oxidoreductase family membrane subunit